MNKYADVTQNHLQYELRDIKSSICTAIPMDETTYNDGVMSEVSGMLSNHLGVEDLIADASNNNESVNDENDPKSSSANQLKKTDALTKASLRYHFENFSGNLRGKTSQMGTSEQ